jgi:hypothetical protein
MDKEPEKAGIRSRSEDGRIWIEADVPAVEYLNDGKRERKPLTPEEFWKVLTEDIPILSVAYRITPFCPLCGSLGTETVPSICFRHGPIAGMVVTTAAADTPPVSVIIPDNARTFPRGPYGDKTRTAPLVRLRGILPGNWSKVVRNGS